MQDATANPIISSRAQAVAAGSENVIWDIINNPWSPTNPDGYVSVGVAENALMYNELLGFLNKNLELPAEYLTYNGGGTGSLRLRRAMCRFLGRHLHPVKPLEPNQLVVTNGVSPAIEHIAWAVTDPGDGILLGRPYYGTFIPDMSTRPGAVVVPVKFDDVSPLSIDAVGKYEEALLDYQEKKGKKVKALMLCHPHNPLGRCYPREVLVKLMQLCQKYGLHFISDEIYALSIWENKVDEHPPPTKFESALSIDTEGIIDPRLVHVLWGLSKDFGANGLRVGVVISQTNRDLQEALKGNSLYTYASGVTDHLASLLLEDDQFTDWYIRENRNRLAEAYVFCVAFLKEHGIEYAPGGNAAFFLWVNLGKKYRELHSEFSGPVVGEIVMQNLLQKKVFLADGELFGSEKDGWFRIVFSQPREYLVEALNRIVAALA